jgi:hypothetical protein
MKGIRFSKEEEDMLYEFIKKLRLKKIKKK